MLSIFFDLHDNKSRFPTCLWSVSYTPSLHYIDLFIGQFVDYYESTIENAFKKTLSVKGSQYELSLVDTAGQDEYSKFPTEYSVDINGYVLVYSIDSLRSFEVCKSINEKLYDLVGENVPLVLVGNKTDLTERRQVTYEVGKQLAEEMKAVFIETSAKENLNVNDIFVLAVSQMEGLLNITKPTTSNCSVMWISEKSSKFKHSVDINANDSLCSFEVCRSINEKLYDLVG